MLILSLFHTTFVAKLELTPIYAKFVAKLVLVTELYRFCCFFMQISQLFHTPFVAKLVLTPITDYRCTNFVANLEFVANLG